ncbi:MAG: sulfatase-like hydrolase/transferase [Pseudomonadota bacterium]
MKHTRDSNTIGTNDAETRAELMAYRPNVLLIVIDQFRADLLDGALAKVAGLKHLAALAEVSCQFRQHYTVVTPCGPSRVSLFTSQYARNHRAVRNGTPLRNDTPNLARAMRAAGYDPLLFGYTDVAQDPRVLPADDPRLQSYEELLPGFTEVVRQRLESDDTAWRDHLRARGYAVPEGMALYVPDGDALNAPARYCAEDSDTAFLTDRFLAYMDGARAPWFATLTYIRPHPPLVAPAPYNRLVDPASVPPTQQSDDNRVHPFVAALREASPAHRAVEGFGAFDATPEQINTLRAVYLGLAAEVDHHIGRVVDWLKSSGHWDDTVLVVTADHGELLGDHGLWGKGSFHDAAFHVPLLMRVPWLSPRRVEAMTESIDVAPTLLDLVGRAAPDAFNGQSLSTLLEGGEGGRAVTVSEHDFGNPIAPSRVQQALGLTAEQANFAVLRTPTHRLVHFAGPLAQVVYDMNDGGERRDIAQRPDSAALRLDLTSQLLSHGMTHPESTFASTLVTNAGVQRAGGG